VVLPGAIGQGDQAVVVGQQLGGRAGALALEHALEGDRVGQRLELDRLQLGDRRLELRVPVGQQALPVLEVVSGALHELRNARLDVLRVDRDRRHEDVAVVDAVLDAVRGGDQQLTGVVLAETPHRELEADRLEGLGDGRPVLAVAEPELRLLGRAAVLLEDQVVRVEVLPALGAGGCGLLVGAREGVLRGRDDSGRL
jgi:hypothetical protein